METGVTYDNVYFLFVDASGHSSVVRSNPRDVAGEAYDLLERRIRERIESVQLRHRCGEATLWTWQGDGGLIVIHDATESVALKTALDIGRQLLKLDLPNLQGEFSAREVKGELHLRLSLHKGAIRYTDPNRTGSIHSSDLNFAAHLESATPADHLTISKQVHDVLPADDETFTEMGTFEGVRVFAASPFYTPSESYRIWLGSNGLGSQAKFSPMLHERPSALEKSRLIRAASEVVFDLGTALNTCSNYLVTTERPAHYRLAVEALLAKDAEYRCYLLHPSSPDIGAVATQFNENTHARVASSLDRLALFHRRMGNAPNFQVFGMQRYPGFASMAIDPRLPTGIILMSPYVHRIARPETTIERADFPHQLMGAHLAEPYYRLVDLIDDYTSDTNCERLI